MSTHSTAVIAPSARIGKNVTIGPYAVVEDETEIGDDCILDAQCQVRRGSVVGSGNRIGSGALIGADPQFRGFDSSLLTETRIGNGNVIREYVTIHRSFEEDGRTEVGNDNYLMNGSHLGHDCRIGDDNTIANNALLAGHVTVGNHCFFGGGSVFHQFIRIGNYVLTQGLSGFSLDLPPCVIGSGINQVAGINSIGLRRAGFDGAARKGLKEIFRALYRRGNSLEEVVSEFGQGEKAPIVKEFVEFLAAPSKKGVCTKFGHE